MQGRTLRERPLQSADPASRKISSTRTRTAELGNISRPVPPAPSRRKQPPGGAPLQTRKLAPPRSRAPHPTRYHPHLARPRPRTRQSKILARSAARSAASRSNPQRQSPSKRCPPDNTRTRPHSSQPHTTGPEYHRSRTSTRHSRPSPTGCGECVRSGSFAQPTSICWPGQCSVRI